MGICGERRRVEGDGGSAGCQLRRGAVRRKEQVGDRGQRERRVFTSSRSLQVHECARVLCACSFVCPLSNVCGCASVCVCERERKEDKRQRECE